MSKFYQSVQLFSPVRRRGRGGKKWKCHGRADESRTFEEDVVAERGEGVGREGKRSANGGRLNEMKGGEMMGAMLMSGERGGLSSLSL